VNTWTEDSGRQHPINLRLRRELSAAKGKDRI